MFGHHTIKVDDGHLLVLPSTRTLNPFARPSVYKVDTTKDEWHWEEKSVSAPFPQTGPRGHLFGQQLIVAGTLTTLGPLKRKGMVTLDMKDFTTSRVTMLDPASQKATKTVNMTNFVSEATHNPDKVWFFGENYLNAKNENASCEVMVWNKGNNTLYSATANTLPIVGDGPKEKKELAVAAVGKDKIYVISPDINSTKLETYVLDTERLEWSLVKTKGDKPVNPRAGFSITASGDKLVFLGYDMSLSDKLMEVYVLDTDTSTWEKVEVTGDEISPRFGHTTTHLGGNQYAVIGGKGYGYFSTSVKDFFKLQLDF